MGRAEGEWWIYSLSQEKGRERSQSRTFEGRVRSSVSRRLGDKIPQCSGIGDCEHTESGVHVFPPIKYDISFASKEF